VTLKLTQDLDIRVESVRKMLIGIAKAFNAMAATYGITLLVLKLAQKHSEILNIRACHGYAYIVDCQMYHLNTVLILMNSLVVTHSPLSPSQTVP